MKKKQKKFDARRRDHFLAKYGYKDGSMSLGNMKYLHHTLKPQLPKLKPMSFLRDYLLYATDNEAPEMFHVWGAYVALSAAVSRKVWLPFGARAMFPNIYVLLVGDAGNGKSVGMWFCKNLIARVTGAETANKNCIPISGSIETAPGLWRFMAGSPNANPPVESCVKFVAKWPDDKLRDVHPMTIIANEFIDFISIDDKGWVNALNNIFDEPVYHYRTKNMGEDVLTGPYIVLFGGLTTDVSKNMQKEQIIATGFARRTLFQYGERDFEHPRSILKETPEQKAAFERCLAHCRLLNSHKVAGAFTWSQECQDWWDGWYNEHTKDIPNKSPNIKSWFTSKPDQVLKLGMLSALSESLDLELKIEHLQLGLTYLEVLEKDLFKIFGGVGRNELAGIAMTMFDFVSAIKEPITMQRFRSQFFHQCKPPTDFDYCVEHLCSSGMLQRYTGAWPEQQALIDLIATPESLAAFCVKHSLQPPKVRPEWPMGL